MENKPKHDNFFIRSWVLEIRVNGVSIPRGMNVTEKDAHIIANTEHNFWKQFDKNLSLSLKKQRFLFNFPEKEQFEPFKVKSY